jgi:hypothetical protein
VAPYVLTGYVGDELLVPVRSRSKFDARQIVNAESTPANDLLDLGQSNRARIEFLQGTARRETASDDRENHGLERWPVLVVERTVDEDGARE